MAASCGSAVDADLKSLSDTVKTIPQQDSQQPSDRITTAFDDCGQFSLARLPDLVLANVFKMLPIPDRASLARTCSRLSAIMHQPSVWTDVTVRLSAAGRVSITSPCDISYADRIMVAKYQEYFQRVDITTEAGYLTYDAFQLLNCFAEKQILKRLVVMTVGTRDLSGVVYRPRESDPGHRHYAVDDYRVPASVLPTVFDLVQKLESTVHFSLYLKMCCEQVVENPFIHVTTGKCISMVSKLVVTGNRFSNRVFKSPIPAAAVLVSRFPGLQELQLSLDEVQDRLLLELSKTSGGRSPLQKMVFWDVRFIRRVGVPPLSPAAWKKLTAACPSLTVECVVRYHCIQQLAPYILPETPLVALRVTCRGEADVNNVRKLFKLCKAHRSTLQRFEFTDVITPCSLQVQIGLKRMVMACPRLVYLRCDVDFHRCLYKRLFTDSRRRWQEFHFNERRVNPQQQLEGHSRCCIL